VTQDPQRVHRVYCIVTVRVPGRGDAVRRDRQLRYRTQDMQGVHGIYNGVAIDVALHRVYGGGSGPAGQERDPADNGQRRADNYGPKGRSRTAHHPLW